MGLQTARVAMDVPVRDAPTSVSPVKAVSALYSSVAAWMRARHDYEILCRMDDRELSDIGIRRGDIHDAVFGKVRD